MRSRPGRGRMVIGFTTTYDGEITTLFYLFARISHACIPALVLNLYIR
jgi:hypothetical protein